MQEQVEQSDEGITTGALANSQSSTFFTSQAQSGIDMNRISGIPAKFGFNPPSYNMMGVGRSTGVGDMNPRAYRQAPRSRPYGKSAETYLIT